MIEGKIASIVDSHAVLINRGKRDGVRPGMKFRAIYKTQRVVDPDDETRVLDGLNFMIGKMEATSVLDAFSYCTVESPIVTTNPLTAFTLAQVERKSLVDPNEPQLAPNTDFKLKVGTIVQEEQPTDEAAKDTSST